MHLTRLAMDFIYRGRRAEVHRQSGKRNQVNEKRTWRARQARRLSVERETKGCGAAAALPGIS